MSEDLIQFYIDNSNNDYKLFERLGKIVHENIIIKNFNRPWNYNIISQNPNITWEFIKANSDKRWNYQFISSNPNITWDIIKENPDKQWSMWEYVKNKNITWNIIRDNPEKFPQFHHYDQLICINPNITINMIKECGRIIPWSDERFRKNPNITWDLLRADPNCAPSFFISHPNITWEIIKSNQTTFGDIHYHNSEITKNPNITWDIIKENPRIHWDYKILSNNRNITWDIIKMNPDKPWDYDELSFNPKITLDIVMNNTDRAWFMITEIKMYKLQKMIELQQFTIERITKTKDDILKKLEDQVKFNEQLCEIIFEKKEEKKRTLIVD
jgi:hypothetical protein